MTRNKKLYTASGVLLITAAVESFIFFVFNFSSAFNGEITFFDFFQVGALLLAALIMLIKPEKPLIGTAFVVLSLSSFFLVGDGLFAVFDGVMFAVFAAAAFLSEKRKIFGFAPFLAYLPFVGVAVRWATAAVSMMDWECSSQAELVYNILQSITLEYTPSLILFAAAFTAAGAALCDPPRTERGIKAHKAGSVGAAVFGVFYFVTFIIMRTNRLSGFVRSRGQEFYALALFLYLPIIIGLFTVPLAFAFKGKEHEAPEGSDGRACVDIVKFIILYIVTFGIYGFYRIMRITEYLNLSPEGKKYSPGGQTALCMFLPYYSLYWIYKHSEKLEVLSREKGIEYRDFPLVFLILAVIAFPVALVVLQDRINKACRVKTEI